MNSGDAATRAQALRDSAAELLQEAAQSTDPASCDALTHRALVQIEVARRLLDLAEAPPSRPAMRLN